MKCYEFIICYLNFCVEVLYFYKKNIINWFKYEIIVIFGWLLFIFVVVLCCTLLDFCCLFGSLRFVFAFRCCYWSLCGMLWPSCWGLPHLTFEHLLSKQLLHFFGGLIVQVWLFLLRNSKECPSSCTKLGARSPTQRDQHYWQSQLI